MTDSDGPAHHTFAIASREELWTGGICSESRLEHGIAQQHGRRIEARDDADPELLAMAERELAELRSAAEFIGGAQLRLAASARRIGATTLSSGVLTITMSGLSIVSTAGHARADAELLRMLTNRDAQEDARPLPIVWRGGSAAVLLHEAVGHAAEHSVARVDWPAWLSVRDEPAVAADDCGAPAGAADLLVEPPRSMRRESFRDVPMRRLSRIVARQTDAPFDLPRERIEVHLVADGSFDPVSDEVTIDIAVADLIEGDVVRALRPFTLVRTRAEVASSLRGASGDPLRYPGVICSREGQQVVVGSYAPMMVTS